MPDVDPAAASVAWISFFFAMLLESQLRPCNVLSAVCRGVKHRMQRTSPQSGWCVAEQAKQAEHCWPLINGGADGVPCGVGCSKVWLDYAHSHCLKLVTNLTLL